MNPKTPKGAVLEDVESAPFIAFDIAPPYGTLSGALQIELAARVIEVLENGSTSTALRCVAHLRCTPAAAQSLLAAIDGALKLASQNQINPVAAKNLN